MNPQTAAQINTPQTGHVELPAKPVSVLVKKPFRAPTVPKPPPVERKKQEPPKGWWQLPAFSGSREGVKKAILNSPIVPDRWKTLLPGEIDDLPAQFNHVRLDAHYTVEDEAHGGTSRRNFHCSIIGSKQLL